MQNHVYKKCLVTRNNAMSNATLQDKNYLYKEDYLEDSIKTTKQKYTEMLAMVSSG